MPRTRIPTRIALALAALAAAAVVVVVVGALSGPDAEPPSARTDPISATGGLDKRIVLFGDTLTATVDVVVDSTVIDPDGVRVDWSHDPWNEVLATRIARRESGAATHLRTTFTLRCLTVPCVPVRETETVEFEPAHVTYAAAVGDGSSRVSVDVPWPPLLVHTRIAGADTDQPDALAAPWRADTDVAPRGLLPRVARARRRAPLRRRSPAPGRRRVHRLPRSPGA